MCVAKCYLLDSNRFHRIVCVKIILNDSAHASVSRLKERNEKCFLYMMQCEFKNIVHILLFESHRIGRFS